MADPNEMPGDEGASKHGEARALADAALRARDAGDNDRAETLLDQARRVDPEAVADVLQEDDAEPAGPVAIDDVDAELALMSTQVQPHSDAPTRSGISGSGSGADDME